MRSRWLNQKRSVSGRMIEKPMRVTFWQDCTVKNRASLCKNCRELLRFDYYLNVKLTYNRNVKIFVTLLCVTCKLT
jgi:RNase P subunit RPR2